VCAGLSFLKELLVLGICKKIRIKEPPGLGICKKRIKEPPDIMKDPAKTQQFFMNFSKELRTMLIYI